MARTFDIRFDAAANSLGWSGGGRLRVDTQGLSFALKRGIASLLARRRSQRIPAEKIIEVYREGDALRVEFATDDNPRAVLPFSARNREAASEIMRLLPTLRTFEVEHGPTESRGERTRASRAAPIVIGVVAAAAWVAVHMRSTENSTVGPSSPAVQDETKTAVPAAPAVPAADFNAAPLDWALDSEPTPEQARRAAIVYGTPLPDPERQSEPPAAARAATPPAARTNAETRADAEDGDGEAFVPMEVPEIQPRPDQLVVRIPQTTLAYGSARGLLNVFETRAAELVSAYRDARNRFDQGGLDKATFADRLDELEKRWIEMGDRLLSKREFTDPALTGMRATLLIVVIRQRVFLTGYAAGLRYADQARIDRAFEELARADEALARARQYVN